MIFNHVQSRSKSANPEQLRLKERAKQVQQQEMEKQQQHNAIETARLAIGPRKKRPRLDGGTTSTLDVSSIC